MGHIHYILYVHDTLNGQPLTCQQQLAVACLKLNETNRLPNKVDFAVGMKAMFLLNLATNTDLANGS